MSEVLSVMEKYKAGYEDRVLDPSGGRDATLYREVGQGQLFSDNVTSETKVQTLSPSGGRAFQAERTVSENGLGPGPACLQQDDLSGKTAASLWAFWALHDRVRRCLLLSRAWV